MPNRTKRRTSKARVPAARVEEIGELAEAVAEEHCHTGPVSPQRIAAAKGITLSFGNYGNTFDGMLECRDGRFHIFCDLDRVKDPHSPRARFTLAHELGHYFIDEHRKALLEGSAPAHPSQCLYESRNHVEQEADHFASSLLMPRIRFVYRGKRLDPGLAGVLALADEFQTSATGTAVRYAALDVGPCAVVKWNWKGFSWKKLSSETFKARFCRTIESPSQLLENSPTYRVFSREEPPASGFFRSGTTAASWFPRVQSEHHRNVLLIEEAIPLGRYGVLTFLYPEGGSYESKPFGGRMSRNR